MPVSPHTYDLITEGGAILYQGMPAKNTFSSLEQGKRGRSQGSSRKEGRGWMNFWGSTFKSGGGEASYSRASPLSLNGDLRHQMVIFITKSGSSSPIGIFITKCGSPPPNPDFHQQAIGHYRGNGGIKRIPQRPRGWRRLINYSVRHSLLCTILQLGNVFVMAAMLHPVYPYARGNLAYH